VATDETPTTERFLLAVGYLAVGAAVLTAWTDPARRYELDIYAATPTAVWAGLAVGVVTGLLVAYHRDVSRRVRTAALVLLGAAVLAVVALPILRNYYFFGPGDSLSHLGYARSIAEGARSPFDLLYPGIHTTAVFLSEVLGVALTRALLFVVLTFAALYAVFVPLAVREITDARWAVVTGTVLGLLLLPINNVSVFALPYPTAQAIWFVPFVLYLALKYVSLPDTSFPRSIAPAGLLLALASVSIVLLHPQQAGSVLLLFGGIVLVQWAYRWFRSDHPVSHQRPLYVQFAFLAAVFLLWAPRFDRVQSAGSGLIQGLLGTEAIGNEITRRAGGLSFLGGSVPELFVKLFGVALLVSIVAGFLILLGLSGRLDDDPQQGSIVRYLSVGHVLLSGAFLVFFLGSVSVLPFRYLGAVMVVVTILGAVALVEGIPVSVPWPSPQALRTVAVVGFTLLLAVQVAHVHESPYIYQSSDQVTKTTMTGYETAFEDRDPDVWFAGIRGGPRRFVDANYGTTYTDRTPGGAVFEGKESRVPFAVFGHNVTQHFGRDRYVPVTDSDVKQEVLLYEGYRYPLRGFRMLQTTPGIHRVQTNGDFRLYYVDDRS
jgi:hypothetical protein